MIRPYPFNKYDIACKINRINNTVAPGLKITRDAEPQSPRQEVIQNGDQA
jgi:hypothetical protein